jgi:hypothetical protein
MSELWVDMDTEPLILNYNGILWGLREEIHCLGLIAAHLIRENSTPSLPGVGIEGKTVKPTHVYLGREIDCGCCTALIGTNHKYTNYHLQAIKKSGRSLHAVTWQHYIDVVRNEEGFMNCQHKCNRLL